MSSPPTCYPSTYKEKDKKSRKNYPHCKSKNVYSMTVLIQLTPSRHYMHRY